LPVLCNDTPEFRYVVGPAGVCRDISDDAGFAVALGEIMRAEVRAPLAAAARAHVAAEFSEPVVLDRMMAMYRAVASDGHAAR
jgi:glycosyltransferase involved in cell wall biosynthesis